MPKRTPRTHEPGRPASLKMLGEFLGLNPSTVSFVLNDTPNRSIPEATRQRVRDAAAQFGYQPSHIARSLRSRRTQTLGVMLPEMSDGYHAEVLNGVATVLMEEDYFFFTVHHRHRKELVTAYPKLLQARGVEGILTIDTHLHAAPAVPTVCIANHAELPGTTSVVLDEDAAALASLGHLHALGHRRIVFMRGQSFSSDSGVRWQATLRAAHALGLTVPHERTILLEQDAVTPELGYPGMRAMLAATRDFTAVLCFNDMAAIGVIRALIDAGVRVPEDCSVVGFDDIPAAAYQVPRLTTVRQPLHPMGEAAALALLRKVAGENVEARISLQPELVVRESTAPVRRG